MKEKSGTSFSPQSKNYQNSSLNKMGLAGPSITPALPSERLIAASNQMRLERVLSGVTLTQVKGSLTRQQLTLHWPSDNSSLRSEERRVGKECRL